MKKTLSALFVGLTAALVPLVAAPAEKATVPASRTEVTFEKPEEFTDVKDDYQGSDKGRDAILDNVKEFLVKRADAWLPEGQKLAITFKDIDLAGDFEPWRGAGLQDVRIVKDLYPPRLKFSFTLTDAMGAVVKSGDVELRDLAFTMRMTMDRMDSLRYEKDMLSDWLRSTVKPAKK